MVFKKVCILVFWTKVASALEWLTKPSHFSAAQLVFVVFQTILMDYVQVEMLFHAKALELHTEAFQSLQLINEDEDLEVSQAGHIKFLIEQRLL